MQYKLGFRVSIIESKPLLFSSRNLCLNELRISSDRNRVVWKYKSLCSSNFVCLTAGIVQQCDSDRYAKNAVSDRFGSLPATNVSYYNQKVTPHTMEAHMRIITLDLTRESTSLQNRIYKY
jgi:hypothetical protein